MTRIGLSRGRPLLLAACLAAAALDGGCSGASHRGREEAPGFLHLDKGVAALAEGIASDMSGSGRMRIAVIEFLDLKQQENELGTLVGEGLVSRLSQGGRFDVVERSLISRVFKEQAFSAQDVVDPQTAQELGQLLGVQAILCGTIADVGDHFSIHARLIDTGTGKVLAAESVDVEQTGPMLTLYRSGGAHPRGTQPEDGRAGGAAPEAAPPADRGAAPEAAAAAVSAPDAGPVALEAAPAAAPEAAPPAAVPAAAAGKTGAGLDRKIRVRAAVPCQDPVPSQTVREQAYRKAVHRAAEQVLRKVVKNWDGLPDLRKEQLIRRVAARSRVQVLKAGKRGNMFQVEILFEPPEKPARE